MAPYFSLSSGGGVPPLFCPFKSDTKSFKFVGAGVLLATFKGCNLTDDRDDKLRGVKALMEDGAIIKALSANVLNDVVIIIVVAVVSFRVCVRDNEFF
jgi:hypothetical protein